MRIILSPTKQMKREEELHFSLSEPVFIEKTKILREYLKGLPYEDLKALLNCNDKIALENYERFQEMDFNQRLTPALLSYDGIAFKYMAPQVFSQEYYDYVSEHLRILSGFYGVLKPFDGICLYRLEMQTKLKTDFCRNLYDYWGKAIYDEVIDESRLIINLASNEYAKTIKPYLSKEDIFVDVVFGEMKGNKVVEKGVYVKMARGEMVAYMASCQAKDIEAVKSFDRLGFHYYEDLSTPTKLVFVRGEENNEKSNEF